MPEDPEISVFVYRIWRKILENSSKEGITPLAYLEIFSRCFAVGTKGKKYCTISVNKARYSGELQSTGKAAVLKGPGLPDMQSKLQEGEALRHQDDKVKNEDHEPEDGEDRKSGNLELDSEEDLESKEEVESLDSEELKQQDDADLLSQPAKTLEHKDGKTLKRQDNSEKPKDKVFVANPHDLARASRAPWAYLVNQRLQAGHICLARRGKTLAIGAGYHLATFHLGLEAHITVMSRTDYDKLIAKDCPGANKNKAKAAKMRSFVLPTEFIEPGSSSKSRRTVNVFAAIVSDSFAIVISDFSRLIRMHITSKSTHWTQEDLQITSPEWPDIWKAFPDGPDWVLEADDALIALQRWRHEVLSGAPGHMFPIVDVMAENTSMAFSGFGRHLANDFLYYAALFPGTPCTWICSDDKRFLRFQESILTYMKIW
ncbi:hypothetical protein CVT26_002417, partial [Gymnopilus dilepis]